VELVEVVLYVRDMDRSVQFYRDTLRIEVEYQSATWTTLRTGVCTLALHATDRREPGRGEPDPTFRIADVDAEHARLASAGVDVSEIREPAPGIRVFDARDPDGNRISIESRSRGAG